MHSAPRSAHLPAPRIARLACLCAPALLLAYRHDCSDSVTSSPVAEGRTVLALKGMTLSRRKQHNRDRMSYISRLARNIASLAGAKKISPRMSRPRRGVIENNERAFSLWDE